MTTMTLSHMIAELEFLKLEHGDVPIVLWDLDTGWYFSTRPENLEVQRVESGLRVSIGINAWDDPHEPGHLQRPIQ